MGLFSKLSSLEESRQQHYRPPAGPPPGSSSVPHDEAPPPFQELDPELPPSANSLPVYTQPDRPPPRYLVQAQSRIDPMYSGAPEAEVGLGDQYCDAYPIFPVRDASSLNETDLESLRLKNLVLGYGFVPPGCTLNAQLYGPNRFGVAAGGKRRFGWRESTEGQIRNDFLNGTAYVRSTRRTKDTTLTTDLPLFSPAIFDLLNTGRFAHIGVSHAGPHGGINADGRPYDFLYYEVTITKLGEKSENASVAIGFTCQPYPPFRLPGWHRGSLAIHSDDGCRYCNDSMGGKPLVAPFEVGQTVGLGLDLAKQVIFITRDGQMDSGWNLWDDKNQSPVDQSRGYRDAIVAGVDGTAEIYPAIGVYGEVGAVVNFGGQVPFKWKYVP
ncbi:hypothetical protein NADFUDRAFT_49224 [Nadsonia fulvescens var. elongata DSM 6958]|uniref:B30.2/SPRY domain-containing protein n=1 Tax=Nadsonia fulvescens var. elongata DSM 6958 TaxID=857566 RepID=A0A1E3PT28_9ASCO|nr:hypothetical protein NADFUDRAFT_49224 [Nadsonia fulvescens var. elongata DSM 6958]